jgi:CRP/FNR family transcriptional regulator
MNLEIAKYLEHYKMVCPHISVEELEYVANELSVTKFKAKEHYLLAGQIQQTIGFLTEGLMRLYYIDEKGNEISVWFTKELEYATDYTSFIRQLPSNYYIVCIEDCTVVNLPYQSMQEGYLKYKNIERYGRLVTEEVFVMQQNRLQSFLFNNAEERYLNFIKNNPDLFNRISLTDLASYLGIERQSLSRIRKLLSQK